MPIHLQRSPDLENSDRSPIPLPRWALPATVVFIVVLFLLRNLPWHLDDYDQAKQAYVSFEMLHEGNWRFQHTPTGKVATKPPLAGWISAGLALLTGQLSWDLAWRLPPFLAALAILSVLARAGRRLAGELGAVVAAAAFGLNLMAPRLATLVRTDMLLSLTIFLVGYLVYEKLFELFALLLASMLIKGPIAYAFLLPGLAFFCWMGRQNDWAARAWSGWWSWFGPLLFFGMWVVVGVTLSSDFYEEVVQKEFLGRFTVGAAARHHNQPIYFYATNLLHRFFPWSLLLLLLASVPDVRQKLRRDPALCWLVCWALGGIIFMSLIPSKRADRIFPVLAPLALLAAGMAALVPRHPYTAWLRPRVAAGLLTGAAIFAGGYAVFQAVQGYRAHDDALVRFGRASAARLQGSRLAVVSGKDEGMLLYLQLSRFTKADKAVALWRAGELDGLVLPRRLLEEHREALAPFRVAMLSATNPAKNSGYALIER
jgi:4-amino-4-deoxy-L-arabinose transferase-like glycosyltransferase